ncbi:MAG: M24 family metallopeptidase [Mesorhizobium sp.]|uniref:M24 family metallopeptidase n=1 Tax=Mesorhizobium sp. TaxID=1871066 RepID=UPI0012088496|nr:M24 family metallopeptidase [Mesorhizobium sp.]TIM28846.1 MAG: M24 family metallopeptidase [Mesorhizobium sp.]TIO21284.1 MAG: M24 family metallopeptidase [Mesorhizobium sp.]
MFYDKPFGPAEYESRISKVKRRMEASGFDLLICQDPASMNWLTGFDGWSFYTPQAVIICLSETGPIWFGRAQDAKSAQITTDIPTCDIIGYSEPLVHHPSKHPFDELCDLIQTRGWASARIGVEMDAHYYTARAHRHLVAGLPNARFADSRELVNWARLVKSEAELVYMREAGRNVSSTMKKAIANVKPGRKQYEIVADVYHSQITGLDGKYGDYTSICPLMQVGEGTSTPHLTWSGEPLPASGLVVMELAAARRHYHTPLTRTLHLGTPSSHIARLAATIVEGGDAALSAARPGVTCSDVERVWQAVLRRDGFEKLSRVGYSIGLNYPPDWGERTASLRDGDTTVLEEGMCFHFQSGVWLAEYGVAVSEPFVVTDKGGERLSNVDRELIVID